MRAAERSRLLLAFAGCVLLGGLLAGPAAAGTFTVSGTFSYEDRIYDKGGYTGTVQNLPIRRADIEVVRSPGNQILATGSTDASGNYSVTVLGQTGTINLYVRCKSSTNYSGVYYIRVGTTRTLGTIYATVTSTVGHNTNTATLAMGSYVLQDLTGFGGAQAFNILDNAVDAFDYLAAPSGIGRYPTAGEYVGYSWGGASGENGSYYSGQVITISGTSTGGDTDGWSDMVILHETGHWASAMFGNDHNTGGAHYIGDIYQDPRLSYGEGYATFFAAQVREFRAPRLNGIGQPVDAHVSIYADLGLPPTLPAAGGLEFSYDFETGLYGTGLAVGQVGSACETNITSVMWDLVDGAATPDESPGVDDEPGDESGASSWAVIQNYMTTLVAPATWISVDDYYLGWFATLGAGFMKAEVDSAFIGLGKLAYYEDAFEPDDDLGTAPTGIVLSYAAGPGGKPVVNEVDLGPVDRLEIQNTADTAVSLSGWVLRFYWNGGNGSYVLPAIDLPPGGLLRVVEGVGTDGGDVVYTGANISWANGAQGACTLENSGATAVDFLRWGGSAQTVPPGTAFTGALASAPGGTTLGRNASGTDTDAAADFALRAPSLGWPNFDVVPLHTAFPAGDLDLVRLNAAGNKVLVVRAESPHSAGVPQLELLDADGVVLGTVASSDGTPRVAQLQLHVPAPATYYLRLRHLGPYTHFAPIQLGTWERPVAQVLDPPLALGASPANASDVGDAVDLRWLNGGDYDSVRVTRDGSPLAVLPGSATDYLDHADRGNHVYGIQGQIGAGTTSVSPASTFAGILDCTFSDDLESGTGAYVLDSPWNATGAIAQAGSFSLTDSPAGDYGDDIDVSAEIEVPSVLTAYPVLEFDHICITEAGYDYGIVEISSDFGTHWVELARYDMADHAGWNDGVAQSGDWVHESLDLNAYVGEKVRIRFRLLTDGLVTEDGWYLDNLQLSTAACRAVTAAGDPPAAAPLLALRANPFRGSLRFAVSAPAGSPARVELFDLAGRRVRTLWEGPLAEGRLDLVWDGEDAAGRPAASGVYFLRVRAGERTAVLRALKLP